LRNLKKRRSAIHDRLFDDASGSVLLFETLQKVASADLIADFKFDRIFNFTCKGLGEVLQLSHNVFVTALQTLLFRSAANSDSEIFGFVESFELFFGSFPAEQFSFAESNPEKRAELVTLAKRIVRPSISLVFAVLNCFWVSLGNGSCV
jgi:hypothetical protein